MAATQSWRPTVWTHVFFVHLLNTLQRHGILAPFWQYGFEHRHARERFGLQNTLGVGKSLTTGQSGLEHLHSWEQPGLYGYQRAANQVALHLGVNVPVESCQTCLSALWRSQQRCKGKSWL